MPAACVPVGLSGPGPTAEKRRRKLPRDPHRRNYDPSIGGGSFENEDTGRTRFVTRPPRSGADNPDTAGRIPKVGTGEGYEDD